MNYFEALEAMCNLAEEAIEWRRVSNDPEDHEFVPFFEEELAQARAILKKMVV